MSSKRMNDRDWPTNLFTENYMLNLLIKLMVLFNASTFCARQGGSMCVCVSKCMCVRYH